MWKENLNLETEIIVKNAGEFDAARISDDYDVIRRGVVLPTSDEMANVLTIFGIPEERKDDREAQPAPASSPLTAADGEPQATPVSAVTENAALLDYWAIPLYFPTSYSLVKPYVVGFDVNSLDAPSLRSVSVDRNWQPRTDVAESN
jgi:hypothetical protein